MADHFLPKTGHVLDSTQDKLNRLDPRQTWPKTDHTTDLIQGRSDHKLDPRQIMPDLKPKIGQTTDLTQDRLSHRLDNEKDQPDLTRHSLDQKFKSQAMDVNPRLVSQGRTVPDSTHVRPSHKRCLVMYMCRSDPRQVHSNFLHSQSWCTT